MYGISVYILQLVTYIVDLIRQSHEIGDIQALAADIRSVAAGLDDGGQHVLGDVLESGRQRVGQGLTALLKGGADGAEQGCLVELYERPW